jgi:hypothetical protein
MLIFKPAFIATTALACGTAIAELQNHAYVASRNLQNLKSHVLQEEYHVAMGERRAMHHGLDLKTSTFQLLHLESITKLRGTVDRGDKLVRRGEQDNTARSTVDGVSETSTSVITVVITKSIAQATATASFTNPALSSIGSDKDKPTLTPTSIMASSSKLTSSKENALLSSSNASNISSSIPTSAPNTTDTVPSIVTASHKSNFDFRNSTHSSRSFQGTGTARYDYRTCPVGLD